MRPAIPNRPATRELTSDVREWGVRMRGVPESSLDGWDLLSRGLSDVPSHSQQAGNAQTAGCACVWWGNSAWRGRDAWRAGI